MSEKQKELVDRLAQALPKMTKEQKTYLNGYADGASDRSKKRKKRKEK